MKTLQLRGAATPPAGVGQGLQDGDEASSCLKIHQTTAQISPVPQTSKLNRLPAFEDALFCVCQVRHQRRRLEQFKLNADNVFIKSVISCLRAMKLDMMSVGH